MGRIYKSSDELIGNTPLLELANIEKDEALQATILGKLESKNPAEIGRASCRERV